MKLQDFKFRIYDTKEKYYLSDDELAPALVSKKNRYEVELLSNLKTTYGTNSYLYDKDIVQIDLHKGDNITRIIAEVIYTDEREWYMRFYSNENTIVSPLETFNINKDFIKDYDKVILYMYGNSHDAGVQDKIKNDTKISFEKLNRILLNTF